MQSTSPFLQVSDSWWCFRNASGLQA